MLTKAQPKRCNSDKGSEVRESNTQQRRSKGKQNTTSQTQQKERETNTEHCWNKSTKRRYSDKGILYWHRQRSQRNQYTALCEHKHRQTTRVQIFDICCRSCCKIFREPLNGQRLAPWFQTSVHCGGYWRGRPPRPGSAEGRAPPVVAYTGVMGARVTPVKPSRAPLSSMMFK